MKVPNFSNCPIFNYALEITELNSFLKSKYCRQEFEKCSQNDFERCIKYRE